MLDSIENNEAIQFPTKIFHLSFPQNAIEIDEERKIENKEYIKKQLKIRLRDFETTQNMEQEERKKTYSNNCRSFWCGFKVKCRYHIQ